MTLPRTRAVLALGLAAAVAAATGGLAGPAAAAPATGQIRLAGGPTAIAGSYLVVLDDAATGARAGSARAASATPARARSLAGSYGATVERVFTAALTGFEARMGEAAARRLAAHPDVAYVEQNHVVSLADTQTGATWGLDRIDQRALPLSTTYTYPRTGSGVRAYIIDTGILTSHSEFAGRASSGRDFVNNDNDTTDCNGHGTHVAGTVGGARYGVAKGVSLIGVRVLNCSGSGSTAGVVAGIDWVRQNAVLPAVANMSLGGGASSTIDSAVSRAVSAGITFVVAAGNSNANACNFSPARAATAITVGATTSSDARASYSNYGSCVDIFAPGSSITSAWYNGTSATRTISGTSMASPHVAGAAALVLAANPGASPAQVTTSLTGSATANAVRSPGTGSPNRLLFVAQ